MKIENSPKILIVAVNYFGHAHLFKYIESLEAQASANWRLVVADNSNDSTEWEAVQSAASNSPKVTAVDVGYNAGYVGALRETSLRLDFGLFDWIVLSNTDLFMGSADSLSELERLDPMSVGVVGPRIVSLDNDRNLNPHLVERPTKKDVVRRSIMFKSRFTAQASVYASYFSRKLAKRHVVAPEFEGVNCYAVHGSWFALSRIFLSDPNCLDYPVWLFGEELHFAESCWKRGLSVEYHSGIKVFHHEHAQTGVRRSPILLDGMIAATTYYSKLYREAEIDGRSTG